MVSSCALQLGPPPTSNNAAAAVCIVVFVYVWRIVTSSLQCSDSFLTSLVTGPVKLIKGSIASSPRQKRNARKRSFEQTLSVTAANILKLEQDRKPPVLEQEPMATEVSHICASDKGEGS